MRVQPPRARILVLALTLLVALQVCLAVFAYLRSTHDADEGFRFPLPARVAAIVETIERTPDADLDILLSALSSEDFRVWIQPSSSFDVAETQRTGMPQIASVIDQYVQHLGDRDVYAWLAPKNGEQIRPPRMQALRLWSAHPMRLAISVNEDEWLMIENNEVPARAVFGFPPGIWASIFGVLIAALSLWTLWRGLGPLERLANSVREYSQNREPSHLQIEGPLETRRIILAVNNMQDELSRFIQERQILFGALSHDLRTHLTRLRLRIESIPDDHKKLKAGRDIDEMHELIEDGLLLARLDAGAVTKKRMDVVALAKDVCNSIERPELFTAATSIETAKVDLDPIAMRRALVNLVNNALTYAEACEVEVAETPGQILIRVLDRGAGLTDTDKTRLLEAFVRGDDARSQSIPGTGLGLAIATRAVDRSGGEFELKDRPGGGLIAECSFKKFN